jgi:hypothetical protein
VNEKTAAPWHVLQRRQYDLKRYARHLSQPELNRRVRDIFINLLILTPEAKIGVLDLNKENAVWMEKWTHVLEEMQLRYGPYPSGFTPDIMHSEQFPDFASALARKAAKKLSALGLRKGDVFLKFGQRQYMEALYKTGALRIQPASFFRDSNLTSAVQDDELRLPFSFGLTREDVIKLVRNPQDVPPVIPEQRVDVQFKLGSDYWLYCVSRAVEPRLFVDFRADSCVIIRDKDEFRRRLSESSKENLGSVTMMEGPANYIDPLLPKSANVFVPLCKHFRYSYQDEYRFCWLPSSSVQRLSHVNIRIGSLGEIADLVIL